MRQFGSNARRQATRFAAASTRPFTTPVFRSRPRLAALLIRGTPARSTRWHDSSTRRVSRRVYAAQFFREPARFMTTTRAAHSGALLRFALATDEEQRRMLSEAEETDPGSSSAVGG
jgi:hypothetical protein